MPPVRHANVLDIASNNKKVYFVSEKTESNIIRETVECETNGLWELDVKSGELRKVSEKCDFINILATENYVYCYRPKYYLPRGVANSWVKGFEIEQIAISGE